MKARHDHGNACWTGRADAVMLWRSAPYSRELVITGPGPIPIQDGKDEAADQGGAEQPRRERRRVFEAFKLCRQTAAVPY